MNVNIDYYKILNISPTASRDEVKKAYYKLAVDYHPDLLTNTFKAVQKLAEEKLKQINAAYEVLSNSESRQAYDAQIQQKSYKQINKRELVSQIYYLAKLEEDFESAAKLAKTLYKTFPEDYNCRNIYAEIVFLLAIHLEKKRELDRAKYYLESCIKITLDPEFKTQIQSILNKKQKSKEVERITRENFAKN